MHAGLWTLLNTSSTDTDRQLQVLLHQVLVCSRVRAAAQRPTRSESKHILTYRPTLLYMLWCYKGHTAVVHIEEEVWTANSSTHLSVCLHSCRWTTWALLTSTEKSAQRPPGHDSSSWRAATGLCGTPEHPGPKHGGTETEKDKHA